jgi:hypothetical protein
MKFVNMFVVLFLALVLQLQNASAQSTSPWQSVPMLNCIDGTSPAVGANELGIFLWGGSARETQGGWEGVTNTGAFYGQSSGRWIPTTTNGAPTAKTSSLCVPITKGFFVWGGQNALGLFENEGAIYYPDNNTWVHCAASPLPPRRATISAWTGFEVLIWNGEGFGAAYKPSTNSWRTMSATNCPTPSSTSADYFHCWTPTGWFVAGGFAGSNSVFDAFLYSPINNTWNHLGSALLAYPTNLSGDWANPTYGNAIWTGSEVVIITQGRATFSGVTSKGGNGCAYNPTTNSWRVINVKGLPKFSRVVWGGVEVYCLPSDAAWIYAYNPKKDKWRVLGQSNFGSSDSSQSFPFPAWIDGKLAIYLHKQLLTYDPTLDR